MRFPALALALAALAGCGSAPIGREPDFTPPQAGAEATAMMTYSLPQEVAVKFITNFALALILESPRKHTIHG